jgi:hypothetical protein
MRPLTLIAVTSFLVAATPHGTRERPNAPSSRATTIIDAWRKLPQAGNGCGEDLVFDYGLDGGMRNFFCRALTVFSWKTFLPLAPVQPFLSGPHKAGKLNLKSRDFGRYNPEFVRWAAKALNPAALDPALREQTQSVYDSQVRSLARLYYRVWRVLSHDRAWLESERQFYKSAMAKGEGDPMGPALYLYHNVLGESSDADPNHVRSATMWWLRRSLDETAPLWLEGLESLLATYDATWLKAEQQKTPQPAPRREKAAE